MRSDPSSKPDATASSRVASPVINMHTVIFELLESLGSGALEVSLVGEPMGAISHFNGVVLEP